MRNIPLLPLLPDPLGPGVIAPGMDQIDLNWVLMLNWIAWNRTVYMYKMDLASNNLQWLICHQTKPSRRYLSHFANLDLSATCFVFSTLAFSSASLIFPYLTLVPTYLGSLLCYSATHLIFSNHILLYNLVMSIITVIQIWKQANSVVSDTNGLLISDFGSWRHEERDTILKSLC